MNKCYFHHSVATHNTSHFELLLRWNKKRSLRKCQFEIGHLMPSLNLRTPAILPCKVKTILKQYRKMMVVKMLSTENENKKLN